jgi:hypothetical protein
MCQVHADEAEGGQDEEGEQLASDAAAKLASTLGGEPAEEEIEDAGLRITVDR